MNALSRSILAALALALSALAACGADPVFITNETAPATVTKDDVKNILLGTKTKWDSGTLIKVAVLAEGAIYDTVIQQYAERTPDQFERFWKKQVFTGKGIAPESFKTDAEVLAYVAKTPGAIGFIGSDTAAAGVKIVKVE